MPTDSSLPSKNHSEPLGFGLILFFLAMLTANIGLWIYSHAKLPQWANVPPAPSALSVQSAFLGDRELAYRASVITLQNFGNLTGEVKALKDYNYDHLGQWFNLSDQLNKISDYTPFLAGYYFGASQNVEQLYPVIAYLRKVGKYPEADKWRWLGQAVFLAKHRLKNDQLALELADELAATYKPGMPAWPLQMRAILASQMGDKDMAHGMMLEILKSSSDKMDPVEVNFMVDYICNTINTPAEKAKDPLCEGK